MTDQLLEWIKCSLIFSGREAEFSKLLNICGSVGQVLAHISGKNVPDDNAKLILEDCKAEGISVITRADPRFPECFYETIPPLLIYAKGDCDILKSTGCIGIIGARRASDYSLGICREFSSELTAAGKVIVSGFALGTDQAAHKSCISKGGRTIAVLGCGIGCGYPAGCTALKSEICGHGLIISEFAPKAKPVPENFTRRNRLISVLSEKLLVIEASDRSGCLNTVSHALDQGREVYVIPPHDISQQRYSGQCGLIRDGAQIAFQPSDLL